MSVTVGVQITNSHSVSIRLIAMASIVESAWTVTFQFQIISIFVLSVDLISGLGLYNHARALLFSASLVLISVTYSIV